MFYTFLKNPAAETLLGHSLELMAREIGKMPECSGVRAVVLGGGYGRGEGGATPEGALCNDLDFFVIPHDGFPQIHSNPLSGTSAGSGKRSFP